MAAIGFLLRRLQASRLFQWVVAIILLGVLLRVATWDQGRVEGVDSRDRLCQGGSAEAEWSRLWEGDLCRVGRTLQEDVAAGKDRE